MSRIRLEGLTRAFDEAGRRHPVLEGAELDVADGEIVVLLGRSGSGKSTLLNLVSGIDRPDAGSILVDEIDVTAMSETERTVFRRRHIGFVFQFFNLIPTLSVVENLWLPLELNGLRDPESEARALELLDDVGLADRAGSYPDTLSGGEQQRIAIARALIHSPKIVLADEPTGNLDKQTGLAVLDLLDQQIRKANKTMIMATHSEEVIGMADRILTLRDGRLVELSP